MFRGMTIEELINSVERAEVHAREEQQTIAVPELWQQPAQCHEMVEVA
jgi:hypothetical protein